MESAAQSQGRTRHLSDKREAREISTKAPMQRPQSRRGASQVGAEAMAEAEGPWSTRKFSRGTSKLKALRHRRRTWERRAEAKDTGTKSSAAQLRDTGEHSRALTRLYFSAPRGRRLVPHRCLQRTPRLARSRHTWCESVQVEFCFSMARASQSRRATSTALSACETSPSPSKDRRLCS